MEARRPFNASVNSTLLSSTIDAIASIGTTIPPEDCLSAPTSEGPAKPASDPMELTTAMPPAAATPRIVGVHARQNTGTPENTPAAASISASTKGIRSSKGGVAIPAINALAAMFKASFPAAAIRYVELSGEPVVLIFNGTDANKDRWWSSRSKRVPEHLWLSRDLDDDSFASDLLSAPATTKCVGKMPAEAWFESVDHDRYEVQEHSVRFPEGIYTVLHLTDEELLAERMSAKRAWRNAE